MKSALSISLSDFRLEQSLTWQHSYDLYKLRRAIVQNRQGSHAALYSQLHNFLKSLGETQPYGLDPNTQLKFKNLSFFVNNTFGSPADIPSRDGFIYRVCTIIDLVKGTNWRNEAAGDELYWNQIYSKSKGKWIRLSKFADGTYKCRPRQFSWWTSFPLSRDVIAGAHQVGMTNDWVAVNCVVLRCPVDYVNDNTLAFVPSVIDAFMHVIFHPTKDAMSPPYGITIDLSLYPMTLSPGTDEVVLPELGVEQVEILPVYANDHYREGKHTVLSGCQILSGLLEYHYRNM